MTRSSRKFRTIGLSSTALALVMGAGVAMAQTQAQTPATTSANGDTTTVETVVVTGSHIHGVQSVGTTVISLGEDDLLHVGATNTNDLLTKVPQITNIGTSETTNYGGTRSQGAGSNQALASSINLRGVGGDATLTLFNGQRVAGGGSGSNVDPNDFSPEMISRIDVQADGGSAIYGSDAIAGTVNFILKEPTDITRVYAQTLFKRGQESWDAGVLLGKTWDLGGREGGIIFNYQHTYEAPTSARDLAYAFTDNLVPYEGAVGAFPTLSTPGNVSGFGTTAAQQATLYAVPTSGIGANNQLTLGQLGPAGVPNRTSLYADTNAVLPQITREAVAFNMKQDVMPWLHFFAFGDYNRRAGVASYGSTPQPSTTLSVPNTNPFSPCATAAAAASAGLPPPSQTNSQGLACPANGTLKLAYNFVNEFGTDILRTFDEKIYMETSGFDIDLPFDWKGRVSQSWSRGTTLSREVGLPNTFAAAQAVSGVGKPSNIPFLNPFCSDAAGPCNSPLTISYIDGFTGAADTNIVADYNFGMDGPIWDLPAGQLRLAVGGEYTDESNLVISNSEVTQAVGLLVPGNSAKGGRYDRAVYAEGYLPVISPDMDIPLINKLELTAAVRYTDYSLPKLYTVNPKYGFNYSPIAQIKIYGSYGTSFKAPQIGQSLPNSSASVQGVNNSQTCSQYAGITCPSPSTVVTGIFFNGGNPDLQPQKGKSWSLGTDWNPDFIPGLALSATYYRLLYTNLISQPAGSGAAPTQVINAGYFDPLVIFNPTYFPNKAIVNQGVLAVLPGLTPGAKLTQAQFNSVLPTLIALPQYSTTVPSPNPTPYIADGLNVNSGFIDTDGIDFSGQYFFDTEYGAAHVGGTATLVLDYRNQPVTGGPINDEDNFFGFVTRFHGRLEAGLQNSMGFDGTLFMNYTNAYKSDPGNVPPAALALSQSYLNIASNITWDLSLGWSAGKTFDDPLLQGTRLQVTVNNVLDKKPPFFLNAASNPAILFDPNQASALGRTITIRLAQDF